MNDLLELKELTKWFRSNWTFQKLTAVDRLSLSIRDGEICGLIGHNGAGKTTTFKMILGLLRPSSGSVIWCGRRLTWNEARAGVGFCPEQPYFYDYLTVRETLNFYGQLYSIGGAELERRVEQLAEEFRIRPKLNTPMRALSKGTLQRVAVAQAIMHRPRLAILDEPMSGLDPAGRKHMRDLIRSLKSTGTTVLFSSHILSDAEALCDRVAILAQGRIQELVDLRDTSEQPIGYTLVATAVPDTTLEALEQMAGAQPIGGPPRWSIKLNDASTVQRALAELQRSGACIEALVPERSSLKHRFLRYVEVGAVAE